MRCKRTSFHPTHSPPPPSIVSLSLSPALLLFEWGAVRLSGLKISWQNVSVYPACCHIQKHFSCSGHLWIDWPWYSPINTKASSRTPSSHTGDAQQDVHFLPHLLLKTHLVAFFLPRTFWVGCLPHSAVLEIKGMSMFIGHTESWSWLNSLTMCQMHSLLPGRPNWPWVLLCALGVEKKSVPAMERTKYSVLERMTTCLKV